MDSMYFSIGKSYFLFLYFYAVTASTFPCLRSLFSAPQFFMRLWRLLFLLREACFLFLIVLCDYGGHGLHYSLSTNPVFCSSVFYATMASAFPSPESLFCVP